MSTWPKSKYDVIIVGARCAGAATGMLLARRGLDVLIIDQGAYGSDTLSTHALMRGGVLQLARWGLIDALIEQGTPLVRNTSFHYGAREVSLPIKPRHGVPGLLAPRRMLLDRLLADAAERAGAHLAYGLRAVDVLGSPSQPQGLVARSTTGRVVRLQANWIIGADGMRSKLASLVAAPTQLQGQHASALIYGYWRGLGDRDAYHWYYTPGASAGVIPTNDGCTCVFAAMPPTRFAARTGQSLATRYHQVLAEVAPDVEAKLHRGQQVGSFRAFPGRAGYLRQAWGPGWALVGDAGYFRDPITAHGMTDALRDAELLARAIERGTPQALAAYQDQRDQLSRPFFEATNAIASFDWDLDSVQRHHLEMSRAMNAELDALLALNAASSPTSSPNAASPTTPPRRVDPPCH